jgi:hypothetical protein
MTAATKVTFLHQSVYSTRVRLMHQWQARRVNFDMISQLASVSPHAKMLSYLSFTTGASQDNQALFNSIESHMRCCIHPRMTPSTKASFSSDQPAIKTMPNTLRKPSPKHTSTQ